MSEPVKRYGIFKRLLDSESYCRRAVARGNQDKFRVNMVLASVYDRDIKARDKQIEGLIKADDAQMAEISEQAETITRLRDELNRVAPFLALHGVEGYTMGRIEPENEKVGRG